MVERLEITVTNKEINWRSSSYMMAVNSAAETFVM